LTERGPGGRLLVDEPAPHVARLTISHPQRRGALDHAILDAFTRTLPGLDARCVIVTGSDGMFSAGYDIAGLSQETFAGEAEQLVAHPFAAALAAIDDYPFPTLAALSGSAIGGGLELALACDLRIASTDARLGMPPGRLGLVYSHTGVRRFIDAIGGPRTRELFLVGSTIDAATGLQWGLVNAVCDPAELPDTALQLATRIAANAPLAQSGNARVIDAVLDGLTPALERELLTLRDASFASADFREGVRAFTEKRPPRWQGR
jgi:enoyl-CoA hydratase/carnithine racemase